jgi:zinc transport system substrate-binding protein
LDATNLHSTCIFWFVALALGQVASESGRILFVIQVKHRGEDMLVKRFVVGVIGLLSVLQFAESICAGEQKTSVFVSIVPQEYFVERIGGERVKVQALVKPGSSPATYEPSPRQMAALSEATLYFRIGVPFEEAFLPKIESTMKTLKIVDTRKGVTFRTMQAHHHHGEEGKAHERHEGDLDAHAGEHVAAGHGEEHHHHVGLDPHIWLSPRLVKIQARTIADALIAIDSAGKGVYERNYQSFAADLDALDARLSKMLAPVKGITFLVFHPAWGYFAEAYGLRQEAIELEGKVPSGRRLAGIIEEAKEEAVKVIFVQPQFSKASAQKIADAIGGVVISINPLARNYIENLEGVATAVRRSLLRQKQAGNVK